jgi:arsenate reductase (glutaredoxin)
VLTPLRSGQLFSLKPPDRFQNHVSLSDSQPLLLHNPNCSKSRAARCWLEENNITFNERLYLDDPLDLEELQELHGYLGEHAREWVRSGESAYREAGLTANSSNEEHLVVMASSPILLERPIFINEGRAAIGRPLARITELV